MILAHLALLCLASAQPLEAGHDDVTLSVLSHDIFISEATCSFGDTTLCLHSIIQNLTQTFLATYQDTPISGSEKRSTSTNNLAIVSDSFGFRGIDAFEPSLTLDKRDARAGAGGFVGNFYWLPLSSEAYDSFDKTPARVELIADELSKYVAEFNATEICVDFGAGIEGGDIIANGVLTFGWGLESFYYADPTLLERRLNVSCGIGNMRMYGTHYQKIVLA
ncbi:hypothetical protein Slin15195_G077220 [Septoria linicola]|uniref:Uncharacterized protein n=1 Tax=Septoria linicola TaxID=215465 RepID=A0A9Q9AYJ6_9PEZI|nr:hypothetical protein Slin14017_G038390 [Septoria linicola]USW54403.1 hypothetical protein Slin15195_G077220 [Septoria linicola]